MKKVAVILGSDSDLPVAERSFEVLRSLGVPFEARVMSAHRTPEAVASFARGAREEGFGAVVAAWLAARILNVHPSLIPSFCGRGFYGLRVHRAVEVLPDDTPEALQRRVMEQAEWRLLPEAVERICQNRGAPSPAPPGRGTCPPAPPLTFPTGGQRPPVGKVEGVPRGRAPSAGFGAEPQGFGSSPAALLGGNRYPGRGIVLGSAPDGGAVLAYFIMGRSAPSRARVFERSGDDLVIRLLDPGRVADPSLILYAPLRVCGEHVVVSNGDQTETIREFLSAGGGFEAALRTRSHEPDAPHLTPRVSGLLTFDGAGGFSYRLSILKAGAEGSCLRQFFEYRAVPGLGHLIHTYAGDGDPLPSFGGEPREVRIGSDLDAFAQGLWAALDAENRVALYVRRYAAEGSGYEDRLFDRHGTGGEGR
ncbi:MAG: IMP cyclohydrolase [Fretibacterium sp.]|nr:IMP cyclohydrolase [Fretibacterium sp.]